MMKPTLLTGAFAIVCAATLYAQSNETTTTTTIDVKQGKDVTVTGCVEAGEEGGYVLTHVSDKSDVMHSYVLVSSKDDFAKAIGHIVEIEGRAADREHGKVEVESRTKVEGVGKDSHAKAEVSGNLSMPYLGVKHMKTTGASCS